MKKALLTLFFAIASRSYAVEFGDIPADYTLYSAGDPFAIALATNNAAVKMNINNGTSSNQTLRLPLVADHLSFSLGTAPTLGAGEIAWDPDWLTFKAGLSNGVEGQFFQEHHIVAKNAWTNTIPNGWIVMHSGVVGNSGKYEVVPAISTPALDPTRVIGMATEDIPVGALGRITARGNVNQIGSDGSLYGASGWENNTPVYLCTTHVGWVTTNLIQAPYPRIYVGNIVRAHSSGAIYIRVQPGLRLADLDDVDGTPLTATGQFPVYDSVRGVFDFDRNVSEFLLASEFGTWLSTNTYVRAEVDQAALAALAAYAATNRVTILRDADDASVWWVAHGGTNLTAYTLAMSWVVRNEALTVIEGENPPFAARSTPRPDIPYPLPAEGYWALDGEITIGTLDGWVSAWLPDTTAWGAAPFASSDHYTLIPISNELIGNIYLDYQSVTNLVGSYNLTTGNVWQAVSDVRQTADDAQLAADQAATLINYHTALDPNPHAGKFVTPMQLTNALAGSGSIIQPIRLASTNIVIAATNAVYALSLTNAANIGFDFSGLALGGTNCAAATLLIDCLNTQALASVFNTNSVAFDMPWEPTVTGCYEVAVRSDGVRTTARQAWPKNDTAQFGYVKYNYAGTSSTFPNLSAIADGSTNGAVYTWVSCPNCMYAVRAQFSGGNAGDTVTFGYYRFVLGYADFISPFVAKTIINPGSPYGFSSGWVIVPSPTPTWLGGPGFANGVGLWVTRSSSTAIVRCTVLEVRKANALEIKAAQAAGY